MKAAELKVKIKSLAAEASIIHQDEIRLKKRARRARARQVDAAVDRLMGSFWSLRKHRVGLKEEIRATLIAIAFLRGRAYGAIEEVAREAPPLGRAEQIAERFGGDAFDPEAWDAWQTAAAHHFHDGHEALQARWAAKGARTLARVEKALQAAAS